ncbi:hypothetical protein [Microbacterium lacticum]|uniref:hypothetical protein n=1 Tax=Microbacterium lacticum TaxID=33885 RepID=UPI0028D66084|nr:hypothetical protein [Microbacterium lacticum]
MSARPSIQRPGSTDPLMTWRAPRLSQTAHAALALLVAIWAMILAVAVVAAAVASAGTVVLFAVLWSFLVTSALYAYAEVVIRR